MWTCPDCGRAFANRNQTHTCAPLGSLADHLDGKPPEIAEIVARVISAAERAGPVTVLPEKTRIALQARMSFAALQPRRAAGPICTGGTGGTRPTQSVSTRAPGAGLRRLGA